MRLDLFLQRWEFAPSRAKAQELIKHGDVEIHRCGIWQVVLLPATEVDPDKKDLVRLRSREILKYASRGGLKLESALDHLKLDVSGCVALDVGISTGGFTDCLLHQGASKVVGIDVGSGQLAERLRRDARIRLFENMNIREIRQRPDVLAAVVEVDLCVIDVSFISLSLVLPEVAAALPPHRLLALIKPQFELSAVELNKNGIVKDAKRLERANLRVQEAATALGYKIHEVFPSAWKGGDGNQEFFLFARR